LNKEIFIGNLELKLILENRSMDISCQPYQKDVKRNVREEIRGEGPGLVASIKLATCSASSFLT